MIEWISTWLKEIIIIVLLATFVDLLLPNTNMQKYAKLVLGLLIILTIISPILDLVTSNVSINHMMEDIKKELNTGKSQKLEMIDPSKTTSDVNQKLIEQVEQSMLASLNDKLERKTEYIAQKVTLDALRNEQGWLINSISVHLIKSNQEKAITDIAGIETVKTVNINIDEKPNSEMDATPSMEDDAVQTIKEMVSKEWGFSKEKIIVNFLE